MLRILLIRHGTTDLLGRVLYGRMPGVHLSAEGREQAQALARALKTRYEVDEVISSPMERALETAHPIAATRSLDVVVDEAFNEIDFGSWIGKSFTELHETEHWQRYCRSRATTQPPGGESMMDVQSRAWKGIVRITDRHSRSEAANATVAVVTHGDVIRAVLMLVLGMSIDQIYRLEAAPASLSELLISRDELQVRTMNETFRYKRGSDT
jgi:broad specificity phosphatase PhoE